ncbi:MAG: glycosyltransferase family 2 protein [Weeksellaceae bacterium]
MQTLSVIILSFNTKAITQQCLERLITSLEKDSSFNSDIIVVDNASIDGSSDMLTAFVKRHKNTKISLRTILSKENTGYTKGNNMGVEKATGKYVLFLNSDVLINDLNWDQLIEFIEADKTVGALTVKVALEDGSLDWASHRGFPTVWRSFSYFTKLEKLTENIPVLNRVFGGYHQGYKDLAATHEVDVITGAFFLIKADLLKKLKGFDEIFFMYGEDIDLAYRIKQAGYRILYYPRYTVTHLKYQSGLGTTATDVKTKTRGYFYDAMKIFYKKHYAKQYPQFFNKLIYKAIDFKSK